MSQLATYLTNHLAGARGGVRLFRRAAKHQGGTSHGAALVEIGDEVAEDLRQLEGLMAQLGIEENRLMSTSVVLAERVGRLKPNGRLFSRPPLTHLIEVEGLRDAVWAKHSGLDALLSAARTDDRLPGDLLRRLKDRAESQLTRLAEIHTDIAQEVFGDEHQ